jgi:hypothetical protein
VGAETLKGFQPTAVLALVLAFLGGFFCHLLYQRWNPSAPEVRQEKDGDLALTGESPAGETHSFRVSFAPLSLPAEAQSERPLLQAREVDKIRALSGAQARVRGRIFRVGHSAKSNTYFLNFGPSREALTAVIFASAADLFEQQKLQLKSFEGKEVEVAGEIKDHPQYGLELIVEGPTQIKILN